MSSRSARVNTWHDFSDFARFPNSSFDLPIQTCWVLLLDSSSVVTGAVSRDRPEAVFTTDTGEGLPGAPLWSDLTLRQQEVSVFIESTMQDQGIYRYECEENMRKMCFYRTKGDTTQASKIDTLTQLEKQCQCCYRAAKTQCWQQISATATGAVKVWTNVGLSVWKLISSNDQGHDDGRC